MEFLALGMFLVWLGGFLTGSIISVTFITNHLEQAKVKTARRAVDDLYPKRDRNDQG